MKRTKNRILSVFLSFCMIISCMAGINVTAGAEPNISYLDADGAEQTCTNYIVVTEETWKLTDGNWYVVNSDVTLTSDYGLTVVGNANLILCDGAKLTVNGGISCIENGDFTIYAQSTGGNMGKLIATYGEDPFGIGNTGGNRTITINGGDIQATGSPTNTGGSDTGIYNGGNPVIINGGKVTALPGFEEGLFYVQDRAARIAVHAAGVMPGMRILDACAAPGGKSMAAVLDARGDCRLTGCDLHEKKLRLILSSAKRLGLEDCLDTLAADARSFRPEWESSFDVVLADVPCSGLGVIRKRPEIRRKGEEELQALPQIQGAILDNLCRYVKPGGVLLYSTCTVLQAENRDQLSSFLQKHPDFSAEDFSVCGIHSADGCYSFWPQIDGTDGFFAAKLRRKTL